MKDTYKSKIMPEDFLNYSTNKTEFNKSLTSKGSGLRYNTGKLRYDLIHTKSLEDMVKVLTYGANKYSDNNWQGGLSWKSVIASLKRHIAAFENGEDFDDESNLLHLSHAACNIHFLNAFYHDFPQGDDRNKKILKFPKIGIDIDGVICDFMSSWHNLYDEIPSNPSTYYCDRKIIERFELMKNNNTLDDFYLNIKPLIKSEELPFDPHCYITSRPVSKEITEKWLDYHNFPAKPVISLEIRDSKVKAAKENNIDIFIDDHFDNFIDLNKNGITCYLYTQPWNIKYKNIGHLRINKLDELPFL